MGRSRKCKHGHSKLGGVTKTYMAWASMKKRCSNPNHSRYKNYGGRGIKVCKRWMEFTGFLEDMGESPEGMSIDRVDNDKDYSPDNCRWTTLERQANNRTDNVYLVYDGRKQSLADWARDLGFNRFTLKSRINLGWSAEKVLTTPIQVK